MLIVKKCSDLKMSINLKSPDRGPWLAKFGSVRQAFLPYHIYILAKIVLRSRKFQILFWRLVHSLYNKKRIIYLWLDYNIWTMYSQAIKISIHYKVMNKYVLHQHQFYYEVCQPYATCISGMDV